MAENSMKPRIRFKGYIDAWEQRKFSDFFEERNERSGNGELISVTVGSGIKKFNELGRFDSKPEDMSNYKRVVEGDIAYNSMRMWQGASGYSPYTGILSPAYTVITPKYGVSAMFFSYVLKRPYMVHLFEINSQGLTSDTWNLKYPAFSQIDTIAPITNDEQNKIASIFSKIDNLITLYQRKYDKIVNIKKALLEKIFPSDAETTPKIRFKGVNGAWEQRKIGDLGVTYAGLSGKKKEDFGHGEAEFIPYLNVFTHPIADVTMTEAIEIDDRQVKVQNGDVLFTTSSETPEEVGMSSVWLKNSSNTYLNSFCFGFRLNESINSFYLAYMLRSKDVRNKIVLLAQGISRYNISKKKMMEINVPIPTDAEQRKVGEIFKQLDNLINLYRQQIEKLKNIKTALLEKMFV